MLDKDARNRLEPNETLKDIYERLSEDLGYGWYCMINYLLKMILLLPEIILFQ